jgi:hypothetical protein
MGDSSIITLFSYVPTLPGGLHSSPRSYGWAVDDSGFLHQSRPSSAVLPSRRIRQDCTPPHSTGFCPSILGDYYHSPHCCTYTGTHTYTGCCTHTSTYTCTGYYTHTSTCTYTGTYRSLAGVCTCCCSPSHSGLCALWRVWPTSGGDRGFDEQCSTFDRIYRDMVYGEDYEEED